MRCGAGGPGDWVTAKHWLVTCSCGWERECSSEWAARSVSKLHPQLAPIDVTHETRVEGPGNGGGCQLRLTEAGAPRRRMMPPVDCSDTAGAGGASGTRVARGMCTRRRLGRSRGMRSGPRRPAAAGAIRSPAGARLENGIRRASKPRSTPPMPPRVSRSASSGARVPAMGATQAPAVVQDHPHGNHLAGVSAGRPLAECDHAIPARAGAG